ncbi:hypothetical protein ACT4S5_13025 [Kocuria oceani]|uniref:hypothetical protein n=1 Tax=Kocuria oceani TaxID=988827 RepID=UPI00403663A4
MRFDHHRVLDHEILDRLRKRYPHQVTSPVREAQEVKQATNVTMPVSLHAPDSGVADDFATALEAVIAPTSGPTI